MNTAQRFPEQALQHDGRTCDPNEEFASIEAAVAGTVRGRWFLDEYVRRAQDRDNERIIAALTRIERMLTADAQVREHQAREHHAAPSARSSATAFAAPPMAPAASGASVPGRPGAALSVLSALRAGGGLGAPTPAPRPTAIPHAPTATIAPAQPAPIRSPARSLTDTLEQALLSMSPQGAGLLKAEAHKPEASQSAVSKPVSSKPAAASPVRPQPPAVPPAPAFTPKPAATARPSQPSLAIDAQAFAHIEAMDAAARAKLFA
jgi:hypothetical protein